MKHSKQYYLRKAHRYLGVFIGIQFLLWTAGGLYFSWSDMKAIRSENLVKHGMEIPLAEATLSPRAAMDSAGIGGEQVVRTQLIDINGQVHYQLVVGHPMEDGHLHEQAYLVDAHSGKVHAGITQDEALALVRSRLTVEPRHVHTTLLEHASKHHEYRGRPLPAWELTFEEPAFTAYVPVEWGVMMTVRNNKWRVFDFLWMLHTMDFEGRDNFGNYLLKGFSILGIITLISGFSLFFSSSPFWRKRFKRGNARQVSE
jgi:uncharacterized iron-regulated membrane protein